MSHWCAVCSYMSMVQGHIVDIGESVSGHPHVESLVGESGLIGQLKK